MNRHSVRFDHLARLTDDTGIIEHALGILPRREEGYSTDDQARALWACIDWMELCKDEDRSLLTRLAETYMAWLVWAQQENGHFHNDYTYERLQEPRRSSDDCLARSIWACAKVITSERMSSYHLAAKTVLERALSIADIIHHPRGLAYLSAAYGLLYRAKVDVKTVGLSGQGELEQRIRTTGEQLADSYRRYSSSKWPWYLPEMTYSNGVLPWGMLWAYEATGRREWLEIALESLDFLIKICQNKDGDIRPVGNQGWCRLDYRAVWDQQPIDVMKLALAADKAFRLTGDEGYARIVEKCRNWFHGSNDLGVVMVDERDGSCYDGLHSKGPNLNCGAESLISYLLTEVIFAEMQREREQIAKGSRQAAAEAARTKSALRF